MAARLVVIVVTAFLGLILGSASALADEEGQHNDQNDQNGKGLTCSGSAIAPGTIAPGTYASITVTGACLIPGGTVRVRGDVSVKQGAAFLANFPAMGPGPEGDANLLVGGDLTVGRGATVILGCSPAVGCAKTTSDRIRGSVRADQPLGLLFHSNSIGGSISMRGGGGGVTCTPSGIFAQFGSPVYSTFEDNTIGGDVSIANYGSCWLGFIRNRSHGDVSIVNNQLADPDAIEILANNIAGDLNCRKNSFVWDSADLSQTGLWPRLQEPNTVHGERTGQCDKLQDPANEFDARGLLPF